MFELYDLNLKQYATSVNDIVQLMNEYGYSAYYLSNNELFQFDPVLHANKIYNVFFKSIATVTSM